MAFVLELQTTSTQPYIRNYIVSMIREFGIAAAVRQQPGRIICAFASEHPDLQACLEAMAQRLPASCFMTGSRYYDAEGEPEAVPEYLPDYPLGLGLCPECQKEMFDPSSRRYYYPFTACSHCGGQYAFLEGYPYRRTNTAFRFLHPCKECEKETQHLGRREHHRINSCHRCGVPVRLTDRQNERYANDAGSFRTMFEVAAKALRDHKRLLMKTTFGFRLFYRADAIAHDSILMMTDAGKITEHLSLIEEEFNALLSIERPVLHVAVQDATLQQSVGRTADVKYPDEGFSILLAMELQRLGLACIAYEDADADTPADLRMEYDLTVTPQKELRLFINKDVRFIAAGERICFPSRFAPATQTLSLAHGLAGVPQGETVLFDRAEHFETVTVERAVVLEGETQRQWHSVQQAVTQEEASFMSVIAEHRLFGVKCVGAYFDEAPTFLYYNGKQVIRLVPPIAFRPETLLSEMAALRDGADRLIGNLQAKLPQVYRRLEALEGRGSVTLFEAAAVLLGLEEENMRGVMREALKFIGKGGLQIDMRLQDNRFDHTAFLSSIVSYLLAEVDKVYLSYSVFESFGDYFTDLLQEIKGKTKAEKFILCGSHFANPSLFSRIQRNLKQSPPLMNVNYPIGRENAVVGGIYL